MLRARQMTAFHRLANVPIVQDCVEVSCCRLLRRCSPFATIEVVVPTTIHALMFVELNDHFLVATPSMTCNAVTITKTIGARLSCDGVLFHELTIFVGSHTHVARVGGVDRIPVFVT